MEASAKEMGRTTLPRIAVSLPNSIRLKTPNAREGRIPLQDPAEAIAILKSYEALGVEHASLGLLMPNIDVYLEQIEMFAERVLPSFR